MKKKVTIFALLAISLLLSNCNNAKRIFKGEVFFVQKPTTDKLTGAKVNIDGLYAGNVIVIDSIISFLFSRYTGYFVSSFKLSNGNHVGDFFKKGQGPGEFIEFNTLHPELDNNYWITDYNKRHYVLVDMSSGIELKRIDFSDYKKMGGLPFTRVFFLNDSLLIAVNSPERKNNNYDIMSPKFILINYFSKEEIKSYEMYDEDLYNKMRGNGRNDQHLSANYRIKPDKSKIVCEMNNMFQINILDLKTGVLKGYRIAGTHGFDFVRTPLPPQDRSYKSYFRLTVDDDYIYAMLDNNFEPDVKPVIHLFDWEGNFVRILEPDQKGVDFDLDRKNKKLYFKDTEENVWVYDVSYLYK